MSTAIATPRFQYSDELMARVRAAARETVDGSLRPRDVAQSLMSEFWDDMDPDDMFRLALVGMDMLLAEARSEMRRKGPARPVVSMLRAKEEPTYTREEVETIHASIECVFSSHAASYSKRAACVADIVKKQGDERERKIADRRERNQASAEREAETISRGFERMTGTIKQAMDEYVLEVFRQINLVGADGRTKTLDVFTMNDVTYWETRSKAHADTWRVRQGWFDDAKRALSRHGVGTLGELPSSVGDGLADRAADIWSDEKGA